MFGIIVVTHGTLGAALLETAAYITSDRMEGTLAVSIGPKDDSEKIRREIVNGIKKIPQGSGVLIFTDMFGGTPSTLSYSFLENANVEVISGGNLPMLIKALSIRNTTPVAEAASTIETYGKKSITLASRLLKAGKKG
ncbi:MAG: PTS fructose transporter subunit IIA [Desulfobacterales bacterium]|jgi:PTS system mannose-specific IIA component|nr:PTS fructose transporter subunit IIA [Desulfobacterales bacterium]